MKKTILLILLLSGCNTTQPPLKLKVLPPPVPPMPNYVVREQTATVVLPQTNRVMSLQWEREPGDGSPSTMQLSYYIMGTTNLYPKPNWIFIGYTTNTNCNITFPPSSPHMFFKCVASNSVTHTTSDQAVTQH